MPSLRSPWINVAAAIAGGAALGVGIYRLASGFVLVGAVWAVIGFLVLGWAVFDRRKFSRGTPESEVGAGRTIE